VTGIKMSGYVESYRYLLSDRVYGFCGQDRVGKDCVIQDVAAGNHGFAPFPFRIKLDFA
jgi:hypothetical protein